MSDLRWTVNVEGDTMGDSVVVHSEVETVLHIRWPSTFHYKLVTEKL